MKPKRMMTTPAIRASSDLYWRENLADFRRDRAQGDEDDAEADDERARIEHHLAEELSFFQLQLLDATPEIRETYPVRAEARRATRTRSVLRRRRRAVMANSSYLSIVATRQNFAS